jgi:F420-non-reducing hydrogenase iron-sulfur subunit
MGFFAARLLLSMMGVETRRVLSSDRLQAHQMPSSSLLPIPGEARAASARVIVLFVCANCARGGQVPTSGKRYRPRAPKFQWPASVYAVEVVVPCAGRLQPEHVLKVFEAGGDAVCVVACEENNCHSGEGSRRCRRRLDYVQRLIADTGMGDNRIMLFHLPGSAAQDMALGTGQLAQPGLPYDQQVTAIRDEVIVRLRTIRPSPLHQQTMPEDALYEVDDQDESDE